MKLKLVLLSLILAFASCHLTNGQNVGNYLKRKTNNAGNHAVNRADHNVDKKVNGEVDKAVDNAFNKLWGDDKKKEDQADSSGQNSGSSSQGASDAPNRAANNALMKKMGISTDVKVQDSYHYTGNIVMDMQSWDENGETEGEVRYTTYVNKDNSGFAMAFSQPEKGKSIIIFDYKEGKMIIMNAESGIKPVW